MPFSDVIIHSLVLAPDGRRMSKSLGTGHGPGRGDRGARRRCDAVRAAQDVLDPGRPLRPRLHRGGPAPGEQALERLAADPPARRAGRARRPDPQSVEERWILARLDDTQARLEEHWSRFEFAAACERALPPDLRRLLRLVRRGDQAATARRRRGRRRDRAGRARAAARAAPPGDAARDRGDLVAPARSHGAADRLAVAGARRRLRRASCTRSTRSRRQPASSAAAESGSSWAPTTSGGSSTQSSAPSAPPAGAADGNLEAERSRLQAEIARAEQKLANERFVEKAPAEVVEAEREKLARYRRELDALGG